MKRIIKHVTIVLALTFVFVMILHTSVVVADNTTVANIISDVNVSRTEAEKNSGPLRELIGTILGFLQVLAAIISVVVIALTGFNYISADSPDLKRDIKQKMLPLIIGMVLVFSAVSVTNFILSVAP